MERQRRTVGYLRVSCIEQDNEKFKSEILHFANERGFVPVQFVEEKVTGTISWTKRDLGGTLHSLQPGDILIVPEISRLARSLGQVIEIIEHCRTNDIAVYSIKGSWALNGNIESKILLYLLGMFSEIERDLISLRTKEALAARKKAGVKLGRPKGPGKSRLDPFRPEIIALLRNGSAKNFVAKRYAVSEPTLYNWLMKNRIDASPIVARTV